MADAAAAIRSGADSVQTVSAEFALKKSRRLVLWSMLGTLVIVVIAEIRKNAGAITPGDVAGAAANPAGAASLGLSVAPHPRIFIGGVAAFFMLAMLAEVAPQLAKPLAVLVFLTVLFERGPEAFSALQGLARRGPRPRGYPSWSAPIGSNKGNLPNSPQQK